MGAHLVAVVVVLVAIVAVPDRVYLNGGSVQVSALAEELTIPGMPNRQQRRKFRTTCMVHPPSINTASV